MLVDDQRFLRPDPIMLLIAQSTGRLASEQRLREGVYQIGHFGSSNWPRGYKSYPALETLNAYGVCDNVEQILAACPLLEVDKERKFVITLTPIVRADQPADGGWRWHKWGPYIGTHEPQCEYLHDETGIDQVLVYHIYERE